MMENLSQLSGSILLYSLAFGLFLSLLISYSVIAMLELIVAHHLLTQSCEPKVGANPPPNYKYTERDLKPRTESNTQTTQR